MRPDYPPIAGRASFILWLSFFNSVQTDNPCSCNPSGDMDIFFRASVGER